MAEPFTIYKLTILYMLSKAGFPLSNTQISNFFLEQEYTDYFRVQEVIGDLVDANLIHAESTHSNTQYSLTSAGKETLGFFKDKLNDGIENDVQGFFEKNKLEFVEEEKLEAVCDIDIAKKVLKKLREEKVNIPVIALTADAIEGQEEKYISEGFDGYLSKPIDKTKLKVILNKYLKGE